MFKSSFAAAIMASYAAAQTAVVTNYSVTTGTLQNAAKADVATTGLSMVYQELVNGVNSYTVMNDTYTMTLAAGTTWSTDANAMVQMAVCYPYTKDAKTLNNCDLVIVTKFTNGAQVDYDRYPSVAKQPTFSTTSALESQLFDVADADCNLSCEASSGVCYTDESTYTSTCDSPTTMINFANSKFTASMFSV